MDSIFVLNRVSIMPLQSFSATSATASVIKELKFPAAALFLICEAQLLFGFSVWFYFSCHG